MASTTRGVIVQTLCTRWTKTSRGAPAVMRRNGTPSSLPLNVARLPVDGVAWHGAEFREPHFLATEAYRERALPSDFHGVTLSLGADLLTVAVLGSTRFELQAGQSGSIVYNQAVDIQLDGWRDSEFQKIVVHVAFGLPARPELFQRTPEQSFASLRNLL